MCSNSVLSSRFHVSFAAVVLMVAFASIASHVMAAESAELKLMSFNVRDLKQSGEDKAENDWNDPQHPRRDRAIRVIQEYNPDILGVQEARDPQIKDLESSLAEYDFYGIGRDDGKTAGEYSGIFFRRDRFRRRGEGSFWLSATPEKPGTTFHTRPGAAPRIASWVELSDKSSGGEFLVLNMHWDNDSEPARRQSAELVRKQLGELGAGLPIIVMGDLNSTEDSPAVKTLLGVVGAGVPTLVDSFRKVHPDRTPEEASYNNWEGITKGSRIDFILCSPEFAPTAAEVVRTAYDGRWPSDHYPVTATLRRQNTKQK